MVWNGERGALVWWPGGLRRVFARLLDRDLNDAGPEVRFTPYAGQPGPFVTLSSANGWLVAFEIREQGYVPSVETLELSHDLVLLQHGLWSGTSDAFAGVGWNGCAWEIHRDNELNYPPTISVFGESRELRRRVAADAGQRFVVWTVIGEDAASRLFGRFESPSCND